MLKKLQPEDAFMKHCRMRDTRKRLFSRGMRIKTHYKLRLVYCSGLVPGTGVLTTGELVRGDDSKQYVISGVFDLQHVTIQPRCKKTCLRVFLVTPKTGFFFATGLNCYIWSIDTNPNVRNHKTSLEA